MKIEKSIIRVLTATTKVLIRPFKNLFNLLRKVIRK